MLMPQYCPMLLIESLVVFTFFLMMPLSNGETKNLPICDDSWSDSMHFDCQLYEGAGWCQPNGLVGVGWCQSKRYQDVTYKSCLAKTNYIFGWGEFSDFISSEDNSTLTADKACPGCGAECSPASSPLRELNPIAENCVDYLDPNGREWRDAWGYTCDAYHHGGFCRISESGEYSAGGLWNIEEYGQITDYRWWAENGSGKLPNNGKKRDAFGACCTCGGGKMAIIGMAVKDLKVKQATKRKVVLEWETSNVSEGVVTYVAMVRKHDSDEGHKVIQTTSKTVTFKKLKPGTDYVATVYAINKSNGKQGLVENIAFRTVSKQNNRKKGMMIYID